MATQGRYALPDLGILDGIGARLFGLVMFVTGWYAVATVFPNELMPYPIETILLTWELIQSGIVGTHLFDTLVRTLLGFVGAMIVGSVIGILMGTNDFGLKFYIPYVIVGLSIPAIAWAAISFLVLGFGLWAPVVATVAVTFPFIAINVWKGVENIDASLVDMGKSFNVGNWRLLRRVVIPNAAPELFSGVRFGMAISWKIVTIAEIFASSSGIGYKLIQSYERYQFERAWAWAVVFMVVILLIEYLILRPLERKAFEYRPDAELDTLL